MPMTPHPPTNAAIERCARYLVIVPSGARPAPLIPSLQRMFELTPAEVRNAIERSNQLRLKRVRT